MSEQTVDANDLLIEFQRFVIEGYQATEDEWEHFGRRAVDVLYENKRRIATLETSIKEVEKATAKLSARDAIDLADAIDIIVHGTVAPGAHIKQSKQLRAYAVALVGEDRASKITEELRRERDQRIAKTKMIEWREAQDEAE